MHNKITNFFMVGNLIGFYILAVWLLKVISAECELSTCNNNGVFDNSSCSCKCNSPFTGVKCDCEISLCQNAGVFDSQICECDCFETFAGKMCEIGPLCEKESRECKSFEQSLCNTYPISYFCPVLCGLCNSEKEITNTLVTDTSTKPTTNISSKNKLSLLMLSIFFLVFLFIILSRR
jgi:hypothetical protein